MIESVFGDQFWWYLARTTGIVAWVLLSASVIWGLLMASGLVSRGTARVLTMEMHRFLGTLAVVFTGLHLVGLFLDSYVQFGVVDQPRLGHSSPAERAHEGESWVEVLAAGQRRHGLGHSWASVLRYVRPLVADVGVRIG